MQVTLTINIDDELITASAESAARALFKAPDPYGQRQGGVGYSVIAKQVESAVIAIDFTEIARETAARFARGIIEDVTKETIKRMAKDVVKSEKTAGTLILEAPCNAKK